LKVTQGPGTVVLFPLQLALLNGSTPDFDGNIPTSLIPAPEFPQEEYDQASAGSGVSTLGPLAVATTSGRLGSGYYNTLMVAAYAPAQIPNIQYRWKRYWKMRQWYLVYNNSTGYWDVSNRDTTGTLPSDAATNGGDNTGPPDDNIPSPGKHEFYAFDDPGLGYGSDASDGQCHNKDYIDEEETFTYQVQYSLDGTTWKNGNSLIFHNQILLQFKQNYTGNLTNDLTLMINTISNGDNDPSMNLTKAAFIVNTGHIILEPDVNLTGP
jgi:hypothetical protein